jgi:hypothetical protein
VRLRGDAEMLAALGIKGIHTPGPKLIDYVSLDPEKFSSKFVGNGVVFSAKGNSGTAFIKRFLTDSPESKSKTHVILNGMFYNLMLAASHAHEGGATIGESVIPGADLPEHLPVHPDYKPYFLKHQFPDGSEMETGPELCRDDEVRFGPALLDDPLFQGEQQGFIPGMLRHANHPNSRAGIVYPGTPEADGPAGPAADDGTGKKFDRIRIFVVTRDNGQIGAGANGMDMNETAELALRLSRMNSTRGGWGINLDGGQSTQLLVLHRTLGPWRKKALEVTQTPLATAANYVVFSLKPEEEAAASRPTEPPVS